MADATPLDPLAMWREMLAQVEKGVNQLASQSVKSEKFAKAANQLSSANRARRKMTQALVSRYSEEFNLPTHSDIEAINERLQALEDRIVEIATTLKRLADALAPVASASGPARTRKPPELAPPAAAPVAAPAPAEPVAAQKAAPARKRAAAGSPRAKAGR